MKPPIRSGYVVALAGLSVAFGLHVAMQASRASTKPADVSSCRCDDRTEVQLAGYQGIFLQTGPATLLDDTRAHDPTLAKDGSAYYVFMTGRGIPVLSSKDLKTWNRAPRVFETAPEWAEQTIPNSRGNFWAPTVAFFASRWHLYYAVSTFGSRHSAIGLATNTTLDSSKPDYLWKDEGIVMQSSPPDDFNAIDPHVTVDKGGTPWLAFGSFWSGLKLVKLDPATGKRSTGDTNIVALAARDRSHPTDGSIEAPCIYEHMGKYYLFASFDFCCRGVNSTYNVRVGRSEHIEGPYIDKAGQPMLQGGGTPVLSAAGRWHGPGHNSVFRDNGSDWMVYHAYDGDENGTPKLRISKITWDNDGWPQSSPELNIDAKS